jgi:hypothetical protein
MSNFTSEQILQMRDRAANQARAAAERLFPADNFRRRSWQTREAWRLFRAMRFPDRFSQTGN